MSGCAKTITAITENTPRGTKLAVVKVYYGKQIDASSVDHESFSVRAYDFENERKIEAVSVGGNTVELRLNVNEATAAIVREPSRPKPKKEEQTPNPKPHRGPPPMVPVKCEPVKVWVRQMKPIKAVDGTELEADTAWNLSDRSMTPVLDTFKQYLYKDMPYNLRMPDNMEEGKEYPLVLFIHDAGVCGTDVKSALAQGNGAIGFATEEWQREHPCFVLAPQVNGEGGYMTNDDFEVNHRLYTIKELLDDVVSRYPVDKKRIYTTGQSMGCMASCELNIWDPDYFAASLLVAGQWSPERMAEKCVHNKLWIVISNHDEKAFPGMNAVTEAMEKNGAVIGRYWWNGKADAQELEAEAKKAMADSVDIRYTVFEGSTVVPEGMPDNGGTNHMSTWPLAYSIRGLKEWMFSCSKE